MGTRKGQEGAGVMEVGGEVAFRVKLLGLGHPQAARPRILLCPSIHRTSSLNITALLLRVSIPWTLDVCIPPHHEMNVASCSLQDSISYIPSTSLSSRLLPLGSPAAAGVPPRLYLPLSISVRPSLSSLFRIIDTCHQHAMFPSLALFSSVLPTSI